MKTTKTITIYTDGGSRGNPGDAAYGFVVSSDQSTLHEEGGYLGIQTNNFAEYTAVIKALEWVREHIGEDITVNLYCDSLLVASQLSGTYKIKHPAIKILAQKALGAASYFSNVSYHHVRRELNKDADRMVNEALDNYVA